MHADWECRGSKKKINEKWFGPIITKVLITARWRLNNLIDAGCPKPAEVKMTNGTTSWLHAKQRNQRKSLST
jgi:hypothetical protein